MIRKIVFDPEPCHEVEKVAEGSLKSVRASRREMMRGCACADEWVRTAPTPFASADPAQAQGRRAPAVAFEEQSASSTPPSLLLGARRPHQVRRDVSRETSVLVIPFDAEQGGLGSGSLSWGDGLAGALVDASASALSALYLCAALPAVSAVVCPVIKR